MIEQRTTGPLKSYLELVYARHNHFSHIFPDPLQHVYRFQDLIDKELAGFLASCFAFGRVQQINRHLHRLFGVMGNPREFLAVMKMNDLVDCFQGWRYRFTDGRNTAYLMLGLQRMLDSHGSLGGYFRSAYRSDRSRGNDTLLHPLVCFTTALRRYAEGGAGLLLPDPEKGSAVKRLNLFLRWMIRRDRVDPGLWDDLPSRYLVVPLDTHMHRIGARLGFTKRKQADLKTAIEVTGGFRTLCAEDPTKYDFGLTKVGISGEGIPWRFDNAVSDRVA